LIIFSAKNARGRNTYTIRTNNDRYIVNDRQQ